jgi:hypothetical protein
MYRFKAYNQPSHEILDFNTEDELRKHIDSLCEQNGYLFPENRDIMMPFLEDFTDSYGFTAQGICLSGVSETGSRTIGFYSRVSCGD